MQPTVSYSDHETGSGELDLVRLIADSPYFDPNFYAFQSEISGSRNVLAEHYLQQGEQRGFQPSRDFDAVFYRHVYLGADRDPGNALASYVGRNDTRLVYANLRQLRADAEAIAATGLLKVASNGIEAWSGSRYKLTSIERFLIEVGAEPLRDETFDEIFYGEAYPDAAAYDRRPLRHYADIGSAQRRVRTAGELEFRKSVMAADFDAAFYASQFPETTEPADLLAHYVLYGARLGFNPAPFFDAEYYLHAYPELRTVELDPFQHFVEYGRAEGRVGRPPSPWSSLIDRIAGSRYFDETYYAALTGITASREVLVRHYLEQGEAAGLQPSRDFDPAFYRHLYLNDDQNRGSVLAAFIAHSDTRTVYATLRQLRADAEAIAIAGLLPGETQGGKRRDGGRYKLTATERLLVDLGGEPLRDETFDEVFYSNNYADAASYDRRALRHYADIGKAQQRVRTQGELEFRKAIVATEFNPAFYAGHFSDASKPSDLLTHYVLHGARLGLDPTPTFNAEYYLAKYEDLRHAGLDPFQHYVEYGRAEKRTGNFDIDQQVKVGGKTFDVAKKTVLVGLHEASRTGAPLLGLTLMEHLSEGCNVIAYLGRGGDIIDGIARHVCRYVVAPFVHADLRGVIRSFKNAEMLDTIVYNSIEAGGLAKIAVEEGIPCVGLIHEFSSYTKPEGQMTRVAEITDRIIVPCELVERSLQAEVFGFRSARLRNVVVRPQGKLPSLPRASGEQNDLTRDELLAFLNVDDDRRTRIVLGAGYVQIRKGVDLFIQTAAALRHSSDRDVRFLWIGDGYNPSRDFAYGIWLADMVERLGVADIVFFLPSQESLDTPFSLADVFYLPSRLDPFPNVCLDAVAADTPIVCFQEATGVAESIGKGDINGAAVPFGDVAAAAAAIKQQLDGGSSSRGEGPRTNAFDFGSYMAFVEEQMRLAGERRGIADVFADRLLESETFDPRFCGAAEVSGGVDASRRTARDFVSKSLNGIDAFNPARGINAGALRQSSDASPTGVLSRLTSQTYESLLTHDCIDLEGVTPVAARRLKVALHIHLHYVDLAAELRTLLDSVQLSADLFLTTTSTDRSIDIDRVFRGFAGGDVRIRVGRNRGRDIGPFILDCRDALQPGRYDLVGHVHGKKSVDLGGAFGSTWRNRLLDNLIGTRRNLSAIETLFAQDPKLGMLFAEDPNCVGWCKNKSLAERLASRVDTDLPLPGSPIFPIGTMFWCRPEVLAPLWQVNLTARDMPVEPLAYDGTILHALERMFPWFCEVAGYRWATVYRSGMAR